MKIVYEAKGFKSWSVEQIGTFTEKIFASTLSKLPPPMFIVLATENGIEACSLPTIDKALGRKGLALAALKVRNILYEYKPHWAALIATAYFQTFREMPTKEKIAHFMKASNRDQCLVRTIYKPNMGSKTRVLKVTRDKGEVVLADLGEYDSIAKRKYTFDMTYTNE